MSTGAGESVSDLDTWDHPDVLGTRLCWRWHGENLTIPATRVEPICTDGTSMEEGGWHADLPTENGATVNLTFDPTANLGNDGESNVSLWLYVAHPDDGRSIEASIGRSDKGDYWIEYDPQCLAGECPGCLHGFDQWWEYVTDGPPQVFNRLRWLGSLTIKAVAK